jgi:hypothetical protein
MRTFILCLALIGCSNSTKPTSSPAIEAAAAPEGPNEQDPAKPEVSSCLDDCMQRNMARSVSAEQIESDCQRECGNQLPVAERMADLQLQSGQMIIIQGRLERAEGGFELHLADGHVVRVQAKNPVSIEAHVGSEVSLSGRYTASDDGHTLSEAKRVGLQ